MPKEAGGRWNRSIDGPADAGSSHDLYATLILTRAAQESVELKKLEMLFFE
jgi:hypothetical protein